MGDVDRPPVHDGEGAAEPFAGDSALANTTQHTSTCTSTSTSNPRHHLSRARGYRYIEQPAHEQVFLNMRLRKMDRQYWGGPRKKEGMWQLALFFVLLVMVLKAGHRADDADGNSGTITLTFAEIGTIVAWLFAVAAVFSLLGRSPYKALLSWMIIYLPLLFLIISLAAFGKKDPSIGWALLACEVLALLLFVLFVVAYPKMIQSKWFRAIFGVVGRWWSLRPVDDWTML